MKGQRRLPYVSNASSCIYVLEHPSIEQRCSCITPTTIDGDIEGNGCTADSCTIDLASIRLLSGLQNLWTRNGGADQRREGEPKGR